MTMIITAPQVLQIQVGETRTLEMDFTNLLSTSETISSVDSVSQTIVGSTTTSDLTLGSASLDSTSKKVRFTCTGGTENNLYLIEVTVTTSSSSVLEGDGKLRVTD